MVEPRLTLRSSALSGHVHRVALLLRMLDLPHRVVETSAEERRGDAFRRLNPLGQVPVLEDGDVVLADSNAILVYLVRRYAPGSDWLPEDSVGAAAVQRFLSIAAGEVMYGPATARLMALWGAPGDPVQVAAVTDRLFRFLEEHLATRDWLAVGHRTIADLACYSYIAHAPEGGLALEPWPHIRAWLRRVEALPGFFPMSAAPHRVAAPAS